MDLAGYKAESCNRRRFDSARKLNPVVSTIKVRVEASKSQIQFVTDGDAQTEVYSASFRYLASALESDTKSIAR